MGIVVGSSDESKRSPFDWSSLAADGIRKMAGNTMHMAMIGLAIQFVMAFCEKLPRG